MSLKETTDPYVDLNAKLFMKVLPEISSILEFSTKIADPSK